MPILRIDYNPKLVGRDTIAAFSEDILEKSMQIFDMKKDLFSVFVREFSEFDFSGACIELEVLCGAHEFVKEGKTVEEVRDTWSQEHASAVTEWKSDRQVGSIISAVTAVNWKVHWNK